MNIEQLKARLKAMEDGLPEFIQSLNRQVAAQEGAIAMLRELIAATEAEQDEVTDELAADSD